MVIVRAFVRLLDTKRICQINSNSMLLVFAYLCIYVNIFKSPRLKLEIRQKVRKICFDWMCEWQRCMWDLSAPFNFHLQFTQNISSQRRIAVYQSNQIAQFKSTHQICCCRCWCWTRDLWERSKVSLHCDCLNFSPANNNQKAMYMPYHARLHRRKWNVLYSRIPYYYTFLTLNYVKHTNDFAPIRER